MGGLLVDQAKSAMHRECQMTRIDADDLAGRGSHFIGCCFVCRGRVREQFSRIRDQGSLSNGNLVESFVQFLPAGCPDTVTGFLEGIVTGIDGDPGRTGGRWFIPLGTSKDVSRSKSSEGVTLY